MKRAREKSRCLSQSPQGPQRRPQNRNPFRPETLLGIFSFSVSPVYSSAAGERIKSLSRAKAPSTQRRANEFGMKMVFLVCLVCLVYLVACCRYSKCGLGNKETLLQSRRNRREGLENATWACDLSLVKKKDLMSHASGLRPATLQFRSSYLFWSFRPNEQGE